ncbi:cation:proton antiporter [Halobacteriales archaeon SW_10_68_16]|jgi:multicomponent Na+:H+ antiporter subunit G|nr:MAG: cation:proton antiporter [Halobacteriales archaeon SW_10_68_16]
MIGTLPTLVGATLLGQVQSYLVVGLVAVGCFFLAVGTVGLLRLPNVYNRMHATSKPTTLGTAAIFLAGFVHFGPGDGGLPSLVGILFLFLTVPTGAHMISRAAQRIGVPFLGSVVWPIEETDVPTTDDIDPSDGDD